MFMGWMFMICLTELVEKVGDDVMTRQCCPRIVCGIVYAFDEMG